MGFSSASKIDPVPIAPVPERAPGVAIAQVYRCRGAVLASHVQSTSAPVPVPCAATRPEESVTVTLHGSALVSRAVKWTGPPSLPTASGA